MVQRLDAKFKINECEIGGINIRYEEEPKKPSNLGKHLAYGSPLVGFILGNITYAYFEGSSPSINMYLIHSAGGLLLGLLPLAISELRNRNS
jgi:hypothetical protein